MDSVGPATFPRSLLKAARSVSFSVADITRGIAHYSRRLIVLTPHRGSVASAFATPLLRPPPLFLSGSFFFFFSMPRNLISSALGKNVLSSALSSCYNLLFYFLSLYLLSLYFYILRLFVLRYKIQKISIFNFQFRHVLFDCLVRNIHLFIIFNSKCVLLVISRLG